MRNYWIVALGIVVILGVVAFLGLPSRESDMNSTGEAGQEIRFIGAEHDFGVVKQSGGLVSHEFSFVYEGDIERKVIGVPTSCGCTTAEVDTDMLVPGQEGVLTVTFDPNLHAEPEGRFFKTAELLTEPPLEAISEVKIWVEIDLDLGPKAYKQSMHIDDHEDEHVGGVAHHMISPGTLKEWLPEKDFFLLDVHIPEQVHIPSTDALIPFNALRENAASLPEDKDAKIVLYCRSGSMSRQAAETLTDMGYTNVWDLEGGINAFNAL